MAKEIINLLVKGGAASGGPPLGPALGPMGIPINKVVDAINEKTAAMKGMDVPVKVIVDTETKTFEIEIGTPPASGLLKKEAGVSKGTGSPVKVANIAIEQVIKVAKTKADNLLGSGLKNNVKEILGTCVSLGFEVEGKDPREIVKEINEGKFDKEISEGKTEADPEKLKTIKARSQELSKEAEKVKVAKAAEAEAAAIPAAEEAEAKPEEKKEEKKEPKKKKKKMR